VQEIYVSTSIPIDAGVIGEQAETLAGDQMRRVREQHFDAGSDRDSHR